MNIDDHSSLSQPSLLEALQQLRDQHLPELSEMVYVDYMGACPDAGDAFWQATRHMNTSPSSTTFGLNTNSVTSSTPTRRPALLGNPHSPHSLGLNSQQSMDKLRRQVLAALGATQEYVVVFTGGTTAGCRLVAECLGSSGGISFYPHILSHNSVLGMRGPLLQNTNNNSTSPTASYGTFRSVADLIELRKDKGSNETSDSTTVATTLVAFPFECNFSGELVYKTMGGEDSNNALANTVKKIKESMCSGEEPLVLVDGAAGMGKHPITLDGTSIDFFVFSFYKWIGAPTGLGALLVRKPVVSGSSGSPLKRLLDGKRYSGGGSVEYQLPHFHNNPTPGGSSGFLLRHATLLKGHRNIETADPSVIVQALEDGTPHFQGVFQASKILDSLIATNHSMSIPTVWFPLFDPKHVEARISSLRTLFLQRAYRALKPPQSSALSRNESWTSQFYPLHEADRNIALRTSTTHTPSAVPVSPHMGSSVAFVVVTTTSSSSSTTPSPSTPHFPFQCVSHALVERLMVHHQNQVCLRAGSFCNPGAALEYLSLSQQEMEEQLIEAGVTDAPAACSNKAVCWDDFSLTSDGRPLGCLRVSFGLLSTPRDVELAVEALASVCTEFRELQPVDNTKTSLTPITTDEEAVSSSTLDGDNHPSPQLKIHSIYVYPVKGCQGFVLDTPGAGWPLGTALQGGMVYDRHWCIVRCSVASPHTSSVVTPLPTLTVLTPKQNSFLSRIKTSFIRIGTPSTSCATWNLGAELAAAMTSQLENSKDDNRQVWNFLAPDLSNTQFVDEGSLLFLILECPKQRVAIAVPANNSAQNQSDDSASASQATTFVRGKQVDSIIRTDSFSELVNNELSAELEEPVYLTTSSGSSDGVGTKGSVPTKGNFSNSGGLLVVHKSSHEVVMDHINRSAANGTSALQQQHISLLSYRPNIVLEDDEVGTYSHEGRGNGRSVNNNNSLPFPELQYDSLAFDSSAVSMSSSLASSETVLVSGAPCHRCTQVGVDTSTGQIKSQPLAAIASISRQYLPALSEGFRRDVLRVSGQYAILFGQVFQIQQQQHATPESRILSIGQRVKPTLRKEPTPLLQ